MTELFVYYRVRLEDAVAARAQVRALHTELRAVAPDLNARLLRRPDDADGQQTWMETYALDPRAGSGGIGADLQAEIEARAARLVTRAAGSRHVEVFIACDS